MKRLISLMALMFCFAAFAQSDEKLEALTKRIEELEKQQQELLLQSGSGNQVNSFLKDELTLGGFVDAGFSIIHGPDTKFQALYNSTTLGLNLAADFSSRFHFVSQILTGLQFPLLNPHNNPAATPSNDREYGGFFFGALVSQAYLEYTFSNNLKLQGGVGYVPFGYALQQRELVLFLRRGGQQIYRTTDLVSPQWSGLHLLGQYSRPNGGTWGYNLYTANPVNVNEAKLIGVGGRVWLAGDQDTYVTGLSAQVGKYSNHTDETVGADFRFRMSDFQITTEYVRHITEGDDVWSAYLEPGLYFAEEEWLAFVFGDYADSAKNKLTATSAVDDPYQKWEYGAGVNWLPSAYTRLRLTFTMNDYVGKNNRIGSQDRDYQSIDLSAGIAF